MKLTRVFFFLNTRGLIKEKDKQMNVRQISHVVHPGDHTYSLSHTITHTHTYTERNLDWIYTHTRTQATPKYTHVHFDVNTRVHLSTLCIILYVFVDYKVFTKSSLTQLYRHFSTCRHLQKGTARQTFVLHGYYIRIIICSC